jgi:hypothetical protein
LSKHFSMDFRSGHALSVITEGDRVHKRGAILSCDSSTTFAGSMFILVVANFPEDRSQLDLSSVTFTPSPRIVRVKVRKEHPSTVSPGTNKFVLRPVLHPVLDLIVGGSFDQSIWLAATDHPSFVRFEGSLEAGGRMLRIERHDHIMNTAQLPHHSDRSRVPVWRPLSRCGPASAMVSSLQAGRHRYSKPDARPHPRTSNITPTAD